MGRTQMPKKMSARLISRRRVMATMAGGVGILAAPEIVRAQAPLTVSFVQQRGLLYLPVDMMVTGGILQQEATKLGLGKIEATAKTLSGPAPIIDALLSGSADYGTAALPSLLTLWDKTHGTPTRSRRSELYRTGPWCSTPSIRTSRRSPISPK